MLCITQSVFFFQGEFCPILPCILILCQAFERDTEMTLSHERDVMSRFRYMISGARANVGLKSGRHMFEARPLGPSSAMKS